MVLIERWRSTRPSGATHRRRNQPKKKRHRIRHSQTTPGAVLTRTRIGERIKKPRTCRGLRVVAFWRNPPQVAGTGSEQTRFRSGEQGVASACDAKCDAISANRIELLTRAVILVAGMNLAEAERAAVLARVIADLTSPTQRIPE